MLSYSSNSYEEKIKIMKYNTEKQNQEGAKKEEGRKEKENSRDTLPLEVIKENHYNCFLNVGSSVQDQVKPWAKCSSGSLQIKHQNSSKEERNGMFILLPK
jgi:hypothetical protein